MQVLLLTAEHGACVRMHVVGLPSPEPSEPISLQLRM